MAVTAILFATPSAGAQSWTDVGEATLVDGWVLPMFGIDQMQPKNQYKVLLQKSTSNEGLYRLVNPYMSGPVANLNNHETKTGYIEFDVSDPDHVVFNKKAAGFAYMDPNDGEKRFNEFYCVNDLGYKMINYTSYTKEQLISMLGDYMSFTTFKDGVVKLDYFDYGDGDIVYDAHYGTDEKPTCYGYWTGPDDKPINMKARIIFPGATYEEGDDDSGNNQGGNDGDDGDEEDNNTGGDSGNTDPGEGDDPGNREPAEDDPNAIMMSAFMTAQLDMNQGMTSPPDLNEPEEFELTAIYYPSTNILKFNSFANSDEPLEFDVDLETGNAEAPGQIALVDDGFTYYYADIATKEDIVTGTLENTEDNTTTMTVAPWGELLLAYQFFNSAYYNTVIVLDGRIPGLLGEENLPTGVGTIENAGPSEVRYFNLQGIEVKNPTPGTILIRREGNKAMKVMTR